MIFLCSSLNRQTFSSRVPLKPTMQSRQPPKIVPSNSSFSSGGKSFRVFPFLEGILIAAAVACIGVYLGTLQMFVEFDNTIWQTWVNGGKLFTARVPHIFLGVLMLLLPWAILFLFPTKFYQLFILFMLIGLSGPVYVLQLLLQPTVKAISDASEKRENELEGKT